MKRKLANKDFLLLCQGSLFSNFGAVLYSAAVGFWVYEKTGSTSLMGILSSISYFIRIFAGPIAGSISDHLRRRNVLVVTDLIRGIVFTVLGYLAFKEKMSIPMVVIVAVLSGLCSSMFTPASTSLTPDMLDESVIIKGQSIVNGSAAIINLVGTAISGALIVSLGVPLLIIINGVCYIVSGISECFIYDYPSHNEKTYSRSLRRAHPHGHFVLVGSRASPYDKRKRQFYMCKHCSPVIFSCRTAHCLRVNNRRPRFGNAAHFLSY